MLSDLDQLMHFGTDVVVVVILNSPDFTHSYRILETGNFVTDNYVMGCLLHQQDNVTSDCLTHTL